MKEKKKLRRPRRLRGRKKKRGRGSKKGRSTVPTRNKREIPHFEKHKDLGGVNKRITPTKLLKNLR